MENKDQHPEQAENVFLALGIIYDHLAHLLQNIDTKDRDQIEKYMILSEALGKLDQTVSYQKIKEDEINMLKKELALAKGLNYRLWQQLKELRG